MSFADAPLSVSRIVRRSLLVFAVMAGAAAVLNAGAWIGTRPVSHADTVLRQALVAAYVQATLAERRATGAPEVVLVPESLTLCPVAWPDAGDCDLLVDQLDGPQVLTGSDHFAPESLVLALAERSSERGPRLSKAVDGTRLAEDDPTPTPTCPRRGPVREWIKFSPAVVDAEGMQALMWVRHRFCDGSLKVVLALLTREGGQWRFANLHAPP